MWIISKEKNQAAKTWNYLLSCDQHLTFGITFENFKMLSVSVFCQKCRISLTLHFESKFLILSPMSRTHFCSHYHSIMWCTSTFFACVEAGLMRTPLSYLITSNPWTCFIVEIFQSGVSGRFSTFLSLLLTMFRFVWN